MAFSSDLLKVRDDVPKREIGFAAPKESIFFFSNLCLYIQT